MSFHYFFSSRRRHTRYWRDWSSDVCSSDLATAGAGHLERGGCAGGAGGLEVGQCVQHGGGAVEGRSQPAAAITVQKDRKSVGEGKGGDLGGRRILKKKHYRHIFTTMRNDSM